MYQFYQEQYIPWWIDSTKSILTKKIEIDTNLYACIVMDIANDTYRSLLLSKITDLIIGNIGGGKNTYKQFQNILETLNFYIKTLEDEQKKSEEPAHTFNLHILIGILENTNFYFSKIGVASCYLLTKEWDFFVVSDEKETSVFEYISSGKIGLGDTIILVNAPFHEILTSQEKEDLKNPKKIDEIHTLLFKIFQENHIDSPLWFLSFQYEILEEVLKKPHPLVKAMEWIYYKLYLHTLVLRIEQYIQKYAWIFEKYKRNIKIVVFLSWILVSIFFLFVILQSFIHTSPKDVDLEKYKTDLIKARNYANLAYENIDNSDLFNHNIKKAEELLSQVKQKKVFLSDIQSIEDDIAILKKQYQGIEVVEWNEGRLIFSWSFQNATKLIEFNQKMYVLTPQSIIWPLIPWKKAKTHIFEAFDIQDEFVDATTVQDGIVIITKKGKVIRFWKNEQFQYASVIGDKSWNVSPWIVSYNNQIYLTNKENTQIYRYAPSGKDFTRGKEYIKTEDINSIAPILSIAIDGWIYILKKDLTLVKIFAFPKYRIQSMILNKLPSNYTHTSTKQPQLFYFPKSKYLYLFLDERIFIFEPNTTSYVDTKSLTYIGQIEGKWEKILSFYVPREKEIYVLTSKGMYKVSFEINNQKLFVQ